MRSGVGCEGFHKCGGADVTYTLMEDIVAFCTIEEAEHVFYYLETRIEALRSLYANFEKSPAKMAVLRICNQLSQRCAPLTCCSSIYSHCSAGAFPSYSSMHVIAGPARPACPSL